MELKAGVILNGTYRIIRLVDERGVGAVYEARHLRGDRRVAIKVLRRKFAEDHEWITRFEREATVASRISSPRLARVLEVGELPNNRRFMVMEFLDGEKLSTRLERERRIPVRMMVDLAAQLLEALEKVHEAGVVHRGISPTNVFLQQMGRLDYVCLLDFGVCKDMMDRLRQVNTGHGRLLSTVAFSAPEAIEKGSRQSDPRSDLFSVGVLLYRCIAGSAPFPARDPGELLMRLRSGPPDPLSLVMPAVDRTLSDIVQRALAYSPGERFQNATAMKDALVQWLARPARHPADGEKKSGARRTGGSTLRLPTSELQDLTRPDALEVDIDLAELTPAPATIRGGHGGHGGDDDDPTITKEVNKNMPRPDKSTLRISTHPGAAAPTQSRPRRR